MRQELRPLIAEFLGIFVLVFAGVGAVVVEQFRPGSVGLLGIATAYGLAFAVAVSATMNISGGHLNPAVTIGFWSVGRIGAVKAVLYVVAQLLGALAAAYAIKGLFPHAAASAAQLGTPHVAAEVSFSQAVLIEAILTFFLATAVMATLVDPAGPRVGGFAVGLTVLFAVVAAGPLTGAALNPGRAFAPAFASGSWTGQAIYWIGPILGSIAAFQLYERLLLKREQ